MLDFTFIDFFAGIGGATLGLNKAGWHCLDAIEKDLTAKEVYKKNIGIEPKRDITNIPVYKLKSADLFCASIPFKYHSKIAWNCLPEDKRESFNYLYLFEFIAYHQPKFLVFEMLTGITDTKTLDIIKFFLADLKYSFYTINLNHKDFGYPLSKKGIYLIACDSKKKLNNLKINPQKTTLKQFWGDCIPQDLIVDEDRYVLFDKRHRLGILRGYLKSAKDEENLAELKANEVYYWRRIFSDDGIFPSFMGAESAYRYYVYSEDLNIVYRLTKEQCYTMMGFPLFFHSNNTLLSSCRHLGQSSSPVIFEAIGKSIRQQFC